MRKEMLINALLPEETRIAIIEDETLEELYVERVTVEQIVGNIYKGRIVNIEPSIQAAFVDFGIGRNGFLHISDVDPTYWEGDGTGLLGQLQEARGGPPARGRRDSKKKDAPKERRPRPEPVRDDFDDRPTNEGMEGEERFAEEESRESRSDDRKQDSLAGEGQGRRRRRRGGRGRKPASERTEETPEPSRPPRHGSDLPDLEDYRIEDDSELHEEPDLFAPDPVEEEPPVEPEARYEDSGVDEFGSGLFDDLDDDELPPPGRPDSVYRRTGPDDDFGSGLFGDDDSDDDDSGKSDMDDVDAELSDESEPFEDEPDEDLPMEDPLLDPFVDFDAEDEDDNFGNRIQDPAEPRRDQRGGQRGRRDRAERSSRGGSPDATRRDRGSSSRSSSSDRSRRPDTRGDRSDDSRGRSRDRDRDRGGSRRRSQSQRWADPRRPRERPPIQEVFRRGQEVIVQVIKEGVGNKGPTLSTYVSIPGRCLVAMPGLPRVGVSRKIVDLAQRRRLRAIMDELECPEGVGFIVRTAGVDRSAEELERDMLYLTRLWEAVVRRLKQHSGPGVGYQESDVIIRTIRDIFNKEIDTIWIDELEAFERARDFMKLAMPAFVDRVKYYDDPYPMFNRFHIEEEIIRIQQRTVPLEKGGSIVIEQAEALVAIDVNSGNFRTDDNNAEETAFQMNMAAAKEIARQLRLRDLGGVIVNDFIDMREERHRRAVEDCLRDSVQRDRARTKILRMSAFGLIEMTRQRIRPSLKRSYYRECPMCSGTGHVKTVESMAIDCLRILIYLGQMGKCRSIELVADHPVSEFLLNYKRKALADIEGRWSVTVNISGRDMTSPEEMDVRCYDTRGTEVSINLSHLIPKRSRT